METHSACKNYTCIASKYQIRHAAVAAMPETSEVGGLELPGALGITCNIVDLLPFATHSPTAYTLVGLNLCT